MVLYITISIHNSVCVGESVAQFIEINEHNEPLLAGPSSLQKKPFSLPTTTINLSKEIGYSLISLTPSNTSLLKGKLFFKKPACEVIEVCNNYNTKIFY